MDEVSIPPGAAPRAVGFDPGLADTGYAALEGGPERHRKKVAEQQKHPDLPPFLVQAVATRVWFSTDEGRRLGHPRLSRRQPSA